MPISAKRPCRYPGCGVLTDSGYCEAHKRERSAGKFGDQRRGSRHDRGYGTAWDKLRKLIMIRDSGLCQPCLKTGRVAEAKQVDHIINKEDWKRQHGSLAGVDDDSNLQAICIECHKAKTQAEAARGRGVSNL